MENNVSIEDFETLGLQTHTTHDEINLAMNAMHRYGGSTKKITTAGGTRLHIDNSANGAKGFYLKKSLIHQILDDLQINDPDDCVFIGFGLETPSDGHSQVHLVFQKSHFLRHREVITRDFPHMPILSTLPHESGEPSHQMPPPGDPFNLDDH
jgi:hypothetical protein